MSTVQNLIAEFSVEQLKLFFRRKISKFKSKEDDYDYLFEDKKEIIDNFSNISKLGDADISNNDDLLVITAQTNEPLTNRSGKKRQYEIAKKILKEENKDAAFFIFYDVDNNFRFSFIRANFLGTKRDFTEFKRYTYFVSKELTNKTFISQISKADFNDLNSIQEAFNVEPLTTQFYKKLQHWYFWAIENIKFPDDAEEEKNGREIAIIRLITRLMFIWFMKVRNLIPGDIFDEDNINKILVDSASQESTYYKAILQNLFFATLNTKQVERKFRTETRGQKGYNPDFGNQNVFRYHDLFKDSESLKTLFEKIPFLNGGLFECLDYKPKGKDKTEKKYIDGFTATKGKQPIVPNFLFFSEVQKQDISKFYGKKNKTYEVEGLINLLKSYNFTIDENEADDIEVALDPELLGSIFENLLASYNPETATTARKATGSFYTPREIVNYMTNESLKQYFSTNLKTDTSEQLNTELEKKLDSLIKSNNSENPFDTEISQKITKLINDLRVVDPAVGSGAFPMAVLNKLVFILGKIDPDNTFWKKSQMDGVKKSVTDPIMQRKLIEQINRQFNEKNADYGRKLYLIEKCIYGVDIQQIAVEIAKLRFFISLLVDEKIEWDKPENNYGIEPLPNLDFKLMQGNSLISSFAGIDFDKPAEKTEDSLFNMDEANTELISKFEELKNEYQNESEKAKKDELREKIENCIYKIVEEKIIPQLRRIEEKYSLLPDVKQQESAGSKKYITKEEIIAKEKQQLAKTLGFDIQQIEKDLKAFTEGHKPKDFFLWNIYFAEVFSYNKGFDIVIGNPPYITYKGKQKIVVSDEEISTYLKIYKNSAEYKINSYALFIEKGTKLFSKNSILSYIIPTTILQNEYLKKIRKYLLLNFNISQIVSFENKVFTAVTDSIIIFVENNKYKNAQTLSFRKENLNFASIKDKKLFTQSKWAHSDYCINIKITFEETKIIEKVEKISNALNKYLDVYVGVVANGIKKFLSTNKENSRFKKYLQGKHIENFIINPIDLFIDFNIEKLHSNTDERVYLKDEKLLVRKTGNKLITAYDNEQYYTDQSIYNLYSKKGNTLKLKYILSLLNSKLLNFYFNKVMITNPDIFPYIKGIHLKKLPLKEICKEHQKPFETLVDQIISKKEIGEDTKELEDKIDLMVYKLYELSYEEVKIIEPEFWMSKENYERKIDGEIMKISKRAKQAFKKFYGREMSDKEIREKVRKIKASRKIPEQRLNMNKLNNQEIETDK